MEHNKSGHQGGGNPSWERGGPWGSNGGRGGQGRGGGPHFGTTNQGRGYGGGGPWGDDNEGMTTQGRERAKDQELQAQRTANRNLRTRVGMLRGEGF